MVARLVTRLDEGKEARVLETVSPIDCGWREWIPVDVLSNRTSFAVKSSQCVPSTPNTR